MNICRQCFREKSTDIGFVKVRFHHSLHRLENGIYDLHLYLHLHRRTQPVSNRTDALTFTRTVPLNQK